MTWLTENWFWILVFVAFVGLHMFGHGGHGGHGGGRRDEHRGHRPSGRDDEPGSSDHQH